MSISLKYAYVHLLSGSKPPLKRSPGNLRGSKSFSLVSI